MVLRLSINTSAAIKESSWIHLGVPFRLWWHHNLKGTPRWIQEDSLTAADVLMEPSPVFFFFFRLEIICANISMIALTAVWQASEGTLGCGADATAGSSASCEFTDSVCWYVCLRLTVKVDFPLPLSPPLLHHNALHLHLALSPWLARWFPAIEIFCFGGAAQIQAWDNHSCYNL